MIDLRKYPTLIAPFQHDSKQPSFVDLKSGKVYALRVIGSNYRSALIYQGIQKTGKHLQLLRRLSKKWEGARYSFGYDFGGVCHYTRNGLQVWEY